MSNIKNFAIKVLKDNGISNPTKSQISAQKDINNNWSNKTSRDITQRSSEFSQNNPSLFNGNTSGWSDEGSDYYE